ncbi:MAG TPA: TolC family protein [Pantanalinema sp.]
MNLRLTLTALALAGVVCAPSSAYAAGTLGLGEAIAIAQRNNLSVAASDAKIAQAKSQINQTYAGLYPQLTLTSSAVNYNIIDSNALIGGLGGMGGLGGGLGGGLSGATGMGGSFGLIQNSLSVSQVLFDGFQTASALKIADASVKMSELDRSNQLRKSAYDTARGYLQVLKASSLREVALRAVEQSQSHLEVARIKERAGTGTRFDVLQAEAQLANVQGQLRSVTNTVELARLSLGTTMGEPVGDRRLAPDLALPRLEATMDLNLQDAVENRPEFQTLVLKRRIDEATVDLNRKANLPKAQAQAQYSQQGLGTGRNFMLMAGLSWTVLDWGKAEAKVSASTLDLAQTDLSIESARRNLSMDVQSSLLNRQDARDRVAIAQKGLQVSQESHRMSQVRYSAGVGTGYEVIDAQTQLVQAQNNYVQATYDLQSAEVGLAQALGVDLSEAVNRKSAAQPKGSSELSMNSPELSKNSPELSKKGY